METQLQNDMKKLFSFFLVRPKLHREKKTVYRFLIKSFPELHTIFYIVWGREECISFHSNVIKFRSFACLNKLMSQITDRDLSNYCEHCFVVVKNVCHQQKVLLVLM